MNSSNYSEYFIKDLKIEEITINDLLVNFKKSVNILQQMRDDVLSKGFENETEEIHFFKEIKPNILSYILICRKIYEIEINIPNNQLLFAEYFNKCINEYNSIFRNTFHSTDFYKYWRTGSCHKDNEFFLRKNNNFENYIQFSFFDFDMEFSTFYDQLLSYYESFNMINQYLQHKMSEYCFLSSKEKSSYSLKWKRSKADLIELIYGLYHANCFDGESISSISNLFSKFYQVELKDVYHTFHRMKDRARSKTSFIDEITSALEKAMTEKD